MPRLRYGSQTNPLQSQGKYGNAKLGPIAPGDTVKPDNEPEELELRSLGNGDVVSDVTYSGNTITVQKSFIQQNSNLLRYGTVVGNALSSLNENPTGFPTILDWEVLDLIPDEFTHGDPIPAMPAGLGYVRLGPGSLEVDHHSWNPDFTEYSTSAALAGQGPVVVHVKFSSTNTVDIHFNKDVSIDAYAAASAVGLFSTAGYPIVATDVQQASSRVIRVVLTRAIEDRHVDILYLRLRNSIVKDSEGRRNQASPTRPVSQPTQSDAYVRVVNRSAAGILPTGAIVALAGPILLEDSNGLTRRVYDIVPLEAHDDVAPTFLGLVIGGNVVATDAAGTTFPVEKPMSLPAPLKKADNEDIVVTKPTVDDWTAVDLADDWAFGDEINRAPDGICFVELVRPFEIGASSWLADMLLPIDDGDPAPEPTLKRIVADNAEVNFFYHKDNLSYGLENTTIVMTNSTTSYSIVFDATGTSADVLEGGLSTGTTVTMSTLTYGFKLVFSTELWTVGEFVRFDVPAAIVSVPTDVFSLAASLRMSYYKDKFKMVYGLNNLGFQIFQKGELVELMATPTLIADANGETRETYKILGTRSAAQIHDHTSFTKEGLGNAYLSLANTLSA